MAARSRASVNQDAGNADGPSRAQGSQTRGKLEAGKLYPGRIVDINGSTYTVQVEGSSLTIPNCVFALPVFLGLAGYRFSGRFSKGDKVMVAHGNPPYIVSGLPGDQSDPANPRSRTHTGFGHGSLMQEVSPGHAHTYPNDLFDGEFEIANMMGMTMLFCTNMISLQAGDRAKVEVCLLNDMVRLFSNEYRHHSALGDEWIFDDGRLSGEANFTSYRHESHGVASKGGALLSNIKDNKADFADLDTANATGYWRGSRWLGWLGDFMSWFVTDPHTSVAVIGQEGWRSGRSRIWTGNDGTVLVQSVSDIVLERVTRVQVPKRKKRHDDPQGNTPDDFDKLNEDWLKKWQDTDPNRPWERAFQLRQYARWLSGRYSLSRFRQASDDWEVPDEDEVPSPSPHHGEDDVKKANPKTTQWMDAYATIRIYRDGSIGMQDIDGSSVTMAAGNVWISAAKHLWLEAGGDVRLIAGQNVVVKARRSVDITAQVGGIILKSRTWWKALCERGTLWLKSDAGDPENPGSKAYTPQSGDPEPEVLPSAVYIQADGGRAEVRATRQVRICSDGAPDNPDSTEDETASVVLESRQQHVTLRPAKDVRIKSRDVLVRCEQWLARVTKTLWSRGDLFDVGGLLTVRDKVHFRTAVAAKLDVVGSLSSPRKGPEPPKDENGNPIPGAKTGPTHYNHVNIVDPNLTVETALPEELEDLNKAMRQGVSGPLAFDKWAFPPVGEYLWDPAEQKYGSYVSPTQQTLTLAPPRGYEDALPTWAWNFNLSGEEPRLLPSTYTNVQSPPWGATLRLRRHTEGDLLSTPSGETPVTAATGWTMGYHVFRFLPYE